MRKAHLKTFFLTFVLAAKIAFLSALIQTSALNMAQAQEACDPYDARVTTTPSPMQRGASLRRYDYVLEHFPKDADVVVFGDSLAEKWPDEELKKLFPNKKIANLGVNADTTQWSLWRLNNSPMLQISPQSVLLVLGTNNLKGAAACAINIGLRTVLLKIHSLWPSATVYMLTIAPRGLIFQDSEADRTSINQYIVSLPQQYGFVKIVTGFDDALTCGTRAVGITQQMFPSYFPDTCENYLPDHLHFTEKGYTVLGDFVKKAMQ